MKRAYGYIRVSTLKQDLSPEVQREQIEMYCKLKGYTLVRVFDEDGVSGGKPFAERKEGKALLRTIGETDAVIFAKLDRAFRNTVDCIMTAAHLRQKGKDVHFLDLGVDTTTPAGQLCMEMMASFAQFERRRISERTREALHMVKRQGRKIGRAPLGFRNSVRIVDGKRVDAGLWTAVAGERAVIEQIHRLRGMTPPTSYRKIVKILKEQGTLTLRGGQWAPETVRKIAARAECG